MKILMKKKKKICTFIIFLMIYLNDIRNTKRKDKLFRIVIVSSISMFLKYVVKVIILNNFFLYIQMYISPFYQKNIFCHILY